MKKLLGIVVAVVVSCIGLVSAAADASHYLNNYTSPGQSLTMKIKTVNVLDTTSTEILEENQNRIDWSIENIGVGNVYIATGAVIADAAAYSYTLNSSTESATVAPAKVHKISSEFMTLKYVGAVYGVSKATGTTCAGCYVPVKVIEVLAQ